ncbi:MULTISPECIES: HNH endonuclease [Streptomyces]|uniref:HNH endonuclease n=1 Tax=Streptomyces venezuelae TaxID=54571 RepID=A0A5P2BE87_STRVZ|nr:MULTISPECIES: HNH endonuclease [Streptomyces]NEA05487.1 HNH endonuclease [Streptomyces sp. SID10116]MYY81104.1 HNH endonuclease [Streptomyces sp. SID335]MYZ12860.1 HNH endonuclease [Streptomyces sp. SID337]NDZ92432.1 HNH endonuclease [Streptomyces sp. SID10115]NEB48378.1 HNH endonuclease [Streptomyces sp. SID339]
MRIPAWTEDELVLAGARVVRNGWRELRTGDPEVQELSELLRSLPIHPPEALGLPEFRSPDSVSRKTSDFATNHPDYTRKGTRCGEPTRLMIKAFIDREAEMLEAAQAIEDGISSGRLQLIPPQPDEIDDSGSTAIEGRLLVRQALARERDQKLRKLKIKQAQQNGKPLRCEVCDFDFARAYGALGEGYIEVHHVTPLHISGPRSTRLDDLACLCANCHRMCHKNRRGESWRTPDALRALIADAASHSPHAASAAADS